MIACTRIGILTRFVSLKLVRSRCGDSSIPQDADFNDCVHEDWGIDTVCIPDWCDLNVETARLRKTRISTSACTRIGILTRFVSLKLVRSRCGDSSTPQDTDFNDCVHEDWDIDTACIPEIWCDSMRRQLDSARHRFQRVRARGLGY